MNQTKPFLPDWNTYPWANWFTIGPEPIWRFRCQNRIDAMKENGKWL